MTDRRSQKKQQSDPILVTLASDNEINRVLQNVGKLKGSGISIFMELPPAMNEVRTEYLTKGRQMKSLGIIIGSRVKHKGSKIWIEVKGLFRCVVGSFLRIE